MFTWMSTKQTYICTNVVLANMFAMLTFRRGHAKLKPMRQFYIELGRNIRRHRQRPGVDLSQDSLAKRVGLSRTSVTNVEQGRQQVPLHMLYIFADALGVEATALLPDKKKMAQEGKRVIVDLQKLPPEVADFVGRVATREDQ